MNLPSYETCQRLAAAGWPQDVNGPTREWWIRNRTTAPWFGDHSDVVNLVGDPDIQFVAAPCIDEMLAEIERQSWGMALTRYCGIGPCYVEINCQPGISYRVTHLDATEALALVLCEALEWFARFGGHAPEQGDPR